MLDKHSDFRFALFIEAESVEEEAASLVESVDT